MERAVLKIFGRVQGVFFRQSALEKAQTLGLSGWIKNAADGTVEAVVEGEKEKIEEFIEWCRQGSKFAKVQKVEVKWEEAAEGLKDFLIK